MRVLHVSAYFAPAYVYGGPPRSILGLCRALSGAGVETEVFTTTANGTTSLPPGRREVEGVPVRYFPWSAPRAWFGASGMARALEAELSRLDLVHVHGLWHVPGWLATRACRRRGVPYVLSPRGMLDPGSFAHHRLRKEVFYRLRERGSLQGASLLHATSANERDAIRGRLPGADVVLVPNGLDPPKCVSVESPRARWKLGAGPLVVFLGRLHPMKRLDLVLEAFRRTVRSVPEARLVVAGREEGAGFASLAGELLGREVCWVGHLGDEDKWALLSEASALVACSDSESFGLSVLEALAAGAPVVVTRNLPWKDVHARSCGYWVEQRSEDIGDAMTALLGNPDEARRMGARGRAYASERYGWPAIGRAMAEHYGRLLEGLPASAGTGPTPAPSALTARP